MFNIAAKPYNEEGVIRPRLVAKSLQIAKLLDTQRQQMATTNGSVIGNIPYQKHAYLIGAMLYFMMERIGYCQDSNQCDPSKAALFHWFHDTLWRTYEQPEAYEQLKKERGPIVEFFHQKSHDFADAVAVLQELNPYDFVVYPLPDNDHLGTQHINMMSKANYISCLDQLQEKYTQDGMHLARLFADMNQKASLRLLLRGMVTMRTIIRGVGEAAIANQDYEIAVRSFQFAGDLTQSTLQERFQKVILQLQNEHPELCEVLMVKLAQSKQDWFSPFAAFYQDVTS